MDEPAACGVLWRVPTLLLKWLQASLVAALQAGDS